MQLGTYASSLPAAARIPPGLLASPKSIREFPPDPSHTRTLSVLPSLGGALEVRDLYLSFPVRGNDNVARALDVADWTEIRRRADRREDYTRLLESIAATREEGPRIDPLRI